MKNWINKLHAHVATWAPKTKDIARYVYHFSSIENVTSILNSGFLLSRSEVQKTSTPHTECASLDVIGHTTPSHVDFVRLYFAPKTPTQYHSEGIRPASGITNLNAHCPVPVFLAFPFVDLLARDETCFSTGNMASAGVEWGNEEALFDRLPFDCIYHRGPTSDHPHRAALTFHRHAEVLVPKRLSTQRVAMIVCRSFPERRTFLNCLTPSVRDKADRMTRVNKTEFYNLEWPFVDGISDTGQEVRIDFHFPVRPITINVRFEYDLNGRKWSCTNACSNRQLHLKLTAPRGGIATITIEGHLAFRDILPVSNQPY